MQGTTLTGYAKMVVGDVVGIGRCGSLVDWGGGATSHRGEDRVYVAFYTAEQIINWRVERVRGRNVPTLVVLAEEGQRSEARGQRSAAVGDEFEQDLVEQIRVLRLVLDAGGNAFCRVDVWQEADRPSRKRSGAPRWVLVESRVPRRWRIAVRRSFVRFGLEG